MRALAANLKMFYQCPTLWFWHAIGLAFIIAGVVEPLGEPVAGQGDFMKFVIVSFWAGLVTASMMKETLGKPLTFCLPRHQRKVRSVIFGVGAAQGLLLSLIVLGYPGLDGVATAAGMVSVACLAMTVYLLSAAAVFLISNAAAFWGVPVLFLGLFRSVFVGVRVAIEDAALFHPLENGVVLLPLALLVAYRLGSRGLARTECGSTFMPVQYFWNRPTMERYNRERRIRKLNRQSRSLWRWIESRFLARMKRLPAYSGRRFTVGSRYVHFGATLPLSPTLVLMVTLGVVALVASLGFVTTSGRFEGFSRANLLYVVPSILGIIVAIPLYSTLLVPAGRREKYRTCLVVGARGAVFALLVSVALYAVSRAIGILLPEVTLSGRTLAYLPMDPEPILAPLLVLPPLYACQIGFPKRPQIPQTVILVGAVLVAMVAPGALRGALLPVLAVLTALSWWCFVGPLHHFCYHRDLALK